MTTTRKPEFTHDDREAYDIVETLLAVHGKAADYFGLSGFDLDLKDLPEELQLAYEHYRPEGEEEAERFELESGRLDLEFYRKAPELIREDEKGFIARLEVLSAKYDKPEQEAAA